MKNVGQNVGNILTAIIGVAILAVLVSERSKTVAVIQAFSTAMTAMLSAVVSPIQPAPPPATATATAGGGSGGGGGKGGGGFNSLPGALSAVTSIGNTFSQLAKVF